MSQKWTVANGLQVWVDGHNAVSSPRICKIVNAAEPVRQLSPEEQKKCAHLIAAAPDLLAALEACLPDLKHYAATHGPGPDRRLEQARAAIAKAKGE